MSTAAEFDAKWLAATPIEALQCRDLRHAWPRAVVPSPRRRARKNTDVPPSSGQDIVWKRLAPGDGANLPAVYERTMRCTGGCGVERIELFRRHHDGALSRIGKPRYRTPSWYRRSRPDPQTPLEKLDTEVLRGGIVARLYPDLRW